MTDDHFFVAYINKLHETIKGIALINHINSAHIPKGLMGYTFASFPRWSKMIINSYPQAEMFIHLFNKLSVIEKRQFLWFLENQLSVIHKNGFRYSLIYKEYESLNKSEE